MRNEKEYVVVCVCSAPNCCDTEQRGGKIIKEIPGSVASGTHSIKYRYEPFSLGLNVLLMKASLVFD